MAGSIIDVEKVRESETEVEYEFNLRRKPEKYQFTIDKKTGEVEYDLEIKRSLVRLAWAAVWKRAGRPDAPIPPETVWPENATHIG